MLPETYLYMVAKYEPVLFRKEAGLIEKSYSKAVSIVNATDGF